jgi:hypothetical protein
MKSVLIPDLALSSGFYSATLFLWIQLIFIFKIFSNPVPKLHNVVFRHPNRSILTSSQIHSR